MDVIVGTAGHIDHGKTALIKALTGIDADRLPEEKRRGITVDLGFAEATIGDIHFGFVDVPGHERFVKNMLAGASGIDLVLLIIAADEGVMPQTREHFDICRLLGIHAGIVVLTKTDLVDAETLEMAKLDASELVARSFLEKTPMVAVSSRTGEGLEELKERIQRVARRIPARRDQLVTRLPIDRSFSMKGFGTVVTGTLASGEITEGAELELLPEAVEVRVRGLQTHGHTVETAGAGQRVAVNLGGIDHAKITRGMVLVPPNTLQSTQIFDAEIDVLPSAQKALRSRQRIRVHIGTIEALARVQALNEAGEIAAGRKDFAQIRLETPVSAVPGERFIIRSYSPQATIAGGSVIDVFADKHRRKDTGAVLKRLNELLLASDDSAETVKILLAGAKTSGLTIADLQARSALATDVLTSAIAANITSGTIVETGGRYISSGEFSDLLRSVENSLEHFHEQEPIAKGMPREALREKLFAFVHPEVFQAVIETMVLKGMIKLDRETISLAAHRTELSPAEAAFSEKIYERYQKAGLEVPKIADVLNEANAGTGLAQQNARQLFQRFLDSGEIVKVTDEFYFARNSIDRLIQAVRHFAEKSDDRLIDVHKFKELAGISRKYAIPLLEYFDREHVTARAGDKRLIL